MDVLRTKKREIECGTPLLQNRFTILQHLCNNIHCGVKTEHLARGPHCIDAVYRTMHFCTDKQCTICSKLNLPCARAEQVSSELDPGHVLTSGQCGRPAGEVRLERQAGSGGKGAGIWPSPGTDSESTSTGHHSALDTGEEDIDWDISSSMCSSLMREVTKIKSEDLEWSLTISKPDLPPQSGHPPVSVQPGQQAGETGDRNVFTATAQTLYSLHKLSPFKCSAIQRWVDTTFMYETSGTYAALQASKRGHKLKKNISYDEDLIKTLSRDFPNHTVIDVFLPNFAYSCVGRMQLGHMGEKFTPNILYVCDSGSSDNMITSQLLQTLYPDFLSLLSKYTGPQIYSCTKTPLCVLGTLNTFIKIGDYGFSDRFLVYECPHPECLLGLRTLQEQNLVITHKALLLNKNRPGGEGLNCGRLGPLNSPIFDVEPVVSTLIPPYTAVMLQIRISPDQVRPGLTKILDTGFAVIHSEEMEASTPEDIGKNNMSIWYTLVTMDKDYTCFVKYNNLTSDSVSLTPGECIGQLELLDAASNQQIDAAGEPVFQYLRRILTPASREAASEPDSKVNRLDLEAASSNSSCPMHSPGVSDTESLVQLLYLTKHV